jgi:hypothetical protein
MRRSLLAFMLLLLLLPIAAHAQLAPAVQASVNAACGGCAVGVSIGSPTDPTTWRLSFAPTATSAQQQQAQTALSAFPLSTWTAQQAAVASAQAALAAGLQITSTAYPALDGTYAATPAAQANISSTMLSIVVTSKFPGGASTMAWYDQAGAVHTFPTTAEFQAFAVAEAAFVAAETLGQSYTQPAAIP